MLSARAHGETDAILSALTFEHGRHLGLVKGGLGRRARPLLQPGNRLGLTWKARLSEHLGHYTAEPMQLFGSRLLDDPLRLAALASAVALLEAGLAEREPHPRLYAALLTLLEAMLADPRWRETYVRFELLLLQELGFALDFAACAVTGATDGSGLCLAAHRPRGQPGRPRASSRPGCCRCRRSCWRTCRLRRPTSPRACGSPAISSPSTCSARPTAPLPAARERLSPRCSAGQTRERSA